MLMLMQVSKFRLGLAQFLSVKFQTMTKLCLENLAIIFTYSLLDKYMHLFTPGNSCSCTPGGCHCLVTQVHPFKFVQFLQNYEPLRQQTKPF